MTHRILSFDNDATEKLAKGADTIARAVVSTFGPRSGNVAIDGYPAPEILHDGVSVAKQVILKDKFENVGASLIREASSKTNDLVGDGTTTAMLLANTLLQGGLKLISNTDGVIGARINRMELREKIDEYSQIIEEKIDGLKKKLTKKDRERVASISASSIEIGSMVTEALDEVGEDGMIMVEESGDFKSSLEYQEGMKFDNGYLSAYFVTDPNRMEARYTATEESESHFVLMTDQRIADGMKLVPIIEKIIKEFGNKRALIIIADNVEGSALNSLALTKVRTGAPLIAVTAPGYADMRKQMLDDLAVLTGGVVITSESGKRLEDLTLQDLGRARNIEVSATHTAIAPFNPDTEEVKERCNSIKEQLKNEENPMRAKALQDRLARLTKGVAIIKVGGASEAEIHDKRERTIDAVHALKAAVADGVVAGGGVALAKIASDILVIDENGEVDQFNNLMYEVLMAPIKTIIENSGGDFDKVIKQINLLENKGYDVVNKKVVDMFEAGILDPAKVTKLAIKHAFSVAGTMLTTKCIITDEPDDGIQKIRVVNNERG